METMRCKTALWRKPRPGISENFGDDRSILKLSNETGNLGGAALVF
jgi:hypothetical protein